MARATAYVFCRYSLTRSDVGLSNEEQFGLLEHLRGKLIAYRIKEPMPSQADTYLLKPRTKRLSGRRVHTWEVAKNIRYRERTQYDADQDDLKKEFVSADEIQHTKFVAIPSLAVLAVDDRSSDQSLGAKSAIGRFEAIVRSLSDVEADVQFAGAPQDVQRALETWSLDRFTFTVRPFNPTVRKPGDTLHDLLVADHAGSINAVVIPDRSHQMRDSRSGIIAEATGLSNANYGQIGATGTTPDGLRASLSKPKFDLDKEKNAKNQAANRMLKVYIEDCASEDAEEAAVIKALLDLYG